jgi:hypothetical protein
MGESNSPGGAGSRRIAVTVALGLAALLGLLLPLMLTSSANAASIVHTAATCPTDAYTHICIASGHSTTTLAASTTSTTSTTVAVATSAHPSTASSSSSLAFTGTNVLRLLLIAAVLIVMGFVIVRINRQRRRSN